MNKIYDIKNSVAIFGLISLVTIILFAFQFRLNFLLLIIILFLLPFCVVLVLRILTRVSTFISTQIAIGIALLMLKLLITLIDNQMSEDQWMILFAIIPLFAVYSITSLIYMLSKKRLPILWIIIICGSAVLFEFITFNWYYSADYRIDSYIFAMILIYIWISLISIIHSVIHRKRGLAKALIPLTINFISIIAIWTITTLLTPVKLNYRYYWRKDGFNHIVQQVEEGTFIPNRYRSIDLPDGYSYLAYSGWVSAELTKEGWAIIFYDSTISGYYYREDGMALAVFDDCGSIRRINMNWFYCKP